MIARTVEFSPMMNDTNINFMTAVEMAQRIRSKEISCVEVMQAHLDADRPREPEGQRHRDIPS